MLEKYPVNMNVEKLRVILLLEADFNTLCKIIFDSRLMSVLEAREQILPEIIDSRRIQVATYLALNKKLITDIASAKKVSIVIIHADEINYSNRVVHPFTSLSSQYFELDISYLLVLFGAIQLIKICLCTSFGVLRQFCTRDNC